MLPFFLYLLNNFSYLLIHPLSDFLDCHQMLQSLSFHTYILPYILTTHLTPYLTDHSVYLSCLVLHCIFLQVMQGKLNIVQDLGTHHGFVWGRKSVFKTLSDNALHFVCHFGHRITLSCIFRKQSVTVLSSRNKMLRNVSCKIHF